MQIINATEYNSYNNKNRQPNTRVFVKRNFASIPFSGKALQSTTTSERYPKHVLNADGRLCLVFSKYNSTNSKWDLYFKASNTTRTAWNSIVEIQSDVTYDYNNPAIVDMIGSDYLGVMVSRDGTDLYSCTVNTSGAIQTALSDTTINGTNPSITKIGSTYWLAYERSDVLYYRTSIDFISWGAETNLNTITGLSNAHNNPYIYYDTSDKLWLVFERVSDAVASPVVKNSYYMNSDDDGSSWNSPVALTVLTAGEGSAVKPSIVDTVSNRYISYTVERQIQNLQDSFGATGNHDFFVVDDTNSRIGMITGLNYSGGWYLCIYDIDAGTFTNHDIKTHMTSGAVQCLAYDSTNKIWVVGTSADGLLTYDENTTTWSNYTESTTPAILGNNIPNQIMAVENKKVYFVSSNSISFAYKLQKLDITGSTNTQLSTLDTPGNPYLFQTNLSSSYIATVVRAQTGGGYPLGYPQIFVLNKSDDSALYSAKLAFGSQYRCRASYDTASNPNARYAQMGWDANNNVLYSLATDTNVSDDTGILKMIVGGSSVSISKYYSMLTGNTSGLLVSPDQPSGKVYFTNKLVFNSSSKRLYIHGYVTNSSVGSIDENFMSVLNATTDLIIEHYAPTNSSVYSSLPVIDASLIKICPVLTSDWGNTRSIYACFDDRKFIFPSNLSGQYYFHIITTESQNQRVYYRKSSNDSDWTTQAYLTSNLKDTYANLGYSDSRLKAFWDRLGDSIHELRWDEDLSSELNITEYVQSTERLMTIENEANSCDIILTDASGLFNPTNYNSLYYDYLQENNIIRIEKGNNGDYTPYFYGFIGAGDADYIRGDGIFYRLTVWDKSKNYYKNKITSGLYQSQTVTAIAEDIAATHMNLSGGDYNFPTVSTIIPQVQFIDETPMDILRKIFQIDNYYPDFDEEGLLIARLINYDASTDFTYYKNGTDTIGANKAPEFNINSVNFSWDDNELVNKVTVIGQEEATGEEEFAEEFMGFLNGVAGWFSKRNQFEFYYSTDKQLKANKPRMVVQDSCGNQFFGGGESLTVDGGDLSVEQDHCIVNQNVSNLIAAIFVLVFSAMIWLSLFGTGIGAVWVYNGLALVVSLGYTFLGQIGSYYYEIYARPIGEPIPDLIIATDQDDDLIDKYNGENELEIDNPLLSSYAKCKTLAENELQKAKWYRYNIRLNIMANLAIQPGDVIELYNSTFGLVQKIYVREISSTYARGSEDMDEITGALIV